MNARGLKNAVLGVTLAAVLACQVGPASAETSGAAASATTVPAQRVQLKQRCSRSGAGLRPKCLAFTQAEPKIVPFNGFFQFLWLPLVAGGGVIAQATAKNGQNCGNGNNNNTGGGNNGQNNGNCPASP